MRQPLIFSCDGADLAGTLHPATGRTGVIIVTGGLQTRYGSHRGFVVLGDHLAKAGFPVLRFDRRGVGDSDGEDPGFRDSGADIAAAVAALRRACPDVRDIIGWGLCDGATALTLHSTGFSGLILANPWMLDSDQVAPLPHPAAIKGHYATRIISARAWLRLLSGKVNLQALLGGILKIARSAPISATSASIIKNLTEYGGKVLVLLAGRDATALAFGALLRSPAFSHFAARATVAVIDGATHTFPGAESERRMIEACLDWLSTLDRPAGADAI